MASELSKMNPEQLVKAYIQSKGADIKVIPTHAVDSAISSIEELLNFLGLDLYPEQE